MKEKRRVRYSNGQVFWDLVRGARFDGRKFLFFSSLAIIFAGGFFLVKNGQFKAPKTSSPQIAVTSTLEPVTGGEANQVATSNEQVATETAGGTLQFHLTADGRLLNASNKEIGKINLFKDFDELKYIVFDQPGSFSNAVNVYLTLPKPITENQLKMEAFAVHGIESHQEEMIDDQKLLFTATGIGPQATFTIAIQFPKNYFSSSFLTRIFISIKSLPITIWIIISLLFPLITLIVMLTMLARRAKDAYLKPISQIVNRPPADLLPAVVGVLLHGKLDEREIAATLLDLLARGELNLYLKNLNPGDEGAFSFLRRRKNDIKVVRPMALFEEILIEKMSLLKSFKSSEEEIEKRLSRHIFSGKVAAIYKEIYQMATSLGLFIENPAIVHRHYKNLGLAAVGLGLIGFLIAAVLGRDYYFLFFGSAGLALTGFVIMKLAANLPIRTEKGRQLASQFLAFGKYLSAKEPLTQEERSQEIFIKYLPIALILGVENPWAERFLAFPPSIPLWFDGEKPPRTLEEFYQGLMRVLAEVSRELVAAKEPTVE